jgi:hypothetical protein
MTGREDTGAKARTLLAEGRLAVVEVGPEVIRAFALGERAETYRLGWHKRRWGCSCPANGACCHLKALWLVVGDPATRSVPRWTKSA